jgi:hypothetical protein
METAAAMAEALNRNQRAGTHQAVKAAIIFPQKKAAIISTAKGHETTLWSKANHEANQPSFHKRGMRIIP